MCGIAGWIGSGLDQQWLESTAAALRHRGPDDHGTLVWPTDRPPLAGLAHTRLAIIDLTHAGAQPMSSTDGRYHLAYNGEVYNYLELRDELVSAGEVFHTASDTEVVLTALRVWGPPALGRFVGMFALALLDTEARSVLLARDPFGMKPLFWAAVPGAVVFASEIAPLLAVPGVSRRAAAAPVYDFLRFGLVDHTRQTMFDDVQRLPAGTHATVPLDSPGQVHPRGYADWSPGATGSSAAERVDTLRELFLDSTRLHLRSDVPVGAALSGGIDSSSVVAAMRAVGPADLDLHTFTFAAGDPSIDEVAWATRVARAVGATSHVVRTDAAELRFDLDALVLRQGEPFATSSIYAQWQVFRAAQETGVTVLLDGQGGDELFAGYRPFLWASIAEDLRAGRLVGAYGQARLAAELSGTGGRASIWTRSLVQALPTGVAATLARARTRPSWIDRDWFAGRCPTPDLRPSSGRATLRAAMDEALHLTVLPSLLRYEDRNSMAFSRESRLPFLTPALARFAAGVPRNELLGPDGRGKWVLREAMRGLVPSEVLDRRDKVGFATPETAWLRASGPWLEERLAQDLADIPVLRPEAVAAGLRTVLAGGSGAEPVWRWLCLARWSVLHEVEWS